jgi:hypothetical protein
MIAREILQKYKENLIGKPVLTEQIGDWPGGLATVTEIEPDPGAPEIVFNVESEHGAVGVFEYEYCLVLHNLQADGCSDSVPEKEQDQ